MTTTEAIERLTRAKDLTFFGRPTLCIAIDLAIDALREKADKESEDDKNAVP